MAAFNNKTRLPFTIGADSERAPLLRSPDRKTGIADIERRTERIKEFRLSDALIDSYYRDMRFVIAMCAIMGAFQRWNLSPEALLVNPKALCSPDLKLLSKVVKETFLEQLTPRC